MSKPTVELHIGHWPDRKKPMLTLFYPETNSSIVIASFKSDEAMYLFARAMGLRDDKAADQ